MLSIGYMKYAPEWIQNFTNDNGGFQIPVNDEKQGKRAFAFFQMFPDATVEKYPALRDRTEEMEKAVQGMAECNAVIVCVKRGHEWKEYGFEPVGAQYANTFALVYGGYY